MTDVTVRDNGSIVLLTPQTNRARVWVEEHIGKDTGYQPYWPTVVCERRYVDDIMLGLMEDGLTVDRAR